jgi:hypothetical protein
MRKTFLYEAHTSKKTALNANHWLELCRTLYNIALDQRISVYRQQKITLSGFD